MFVLLFLGFVLSAYCLGQAPVDPVTILDVLKNDPDVRTFKNLIQGTGGGLLNWGKFGVKSESMNVLFDIDTW
jgi:hypothetical protein